MAVVNLGDHLSQFYITVYYLYAGHSNALINIALYWCCFLELFSYIVAVALDILYQMKQKSKRCNLVLSIDIFTFAKKNKSRLSLTV